MVKKYFGDVDPIGKLMVIGGENKTFKVTGIAENPPSNTHFHFNMLVSSQSYDRLKQPIWLNNYMYNYYLLRENSSVDQVDSKFEGLVVKYVGPEVERFMGTTLKQMKDGGENMVIFQLS
jgi:putative ABC transport system permease protein